MPSLVYRLVEQAFNQGDLAVVDEVVAADGITHALSWGLPTSRMGLKQLVISFRSAFPDLSWTMQDEIIQGDKTAAHWTIRGTHKGVFIGNSPTGRQIRVQGFIFARTANGRIVENWFLVDQIGILQQLGIIPPPGH